VLRRELNLSNSQYAYAVNAFMVAYAIMYLVIGRLIDLLNTRRGLGLSFGVWSIASFCHSFIVGLWDLCFWRFLLGASEPGNFPACVKAVASWFPARERGLAIGLVFGGTAIGAIIAPPLIVWLTVHYGWRMAFLLTSLGGMFWLLFWFGWYREPEEHPRITPQEFQHIRSDDEVDGGKGQPFGWQKLLKLPQAWSFVLARFFADSLGYFNFFWIPSYLVSAKGFSFQSMGELLWIPFLFQDLGSIIGGYASGVLIKRGLAPIWARKLTMSLSLLLIPAGIFSIRASQPFYVILCISVATFGLGWWSPNIHSLMMDSFPRYSVASIGGLSGSGGAVGGVIFTWFTGYAADRGAYHLVFYTTGLLTFLSILSTWVFLRTPVGEKPEL
jgi:ACS family hexuronate transporter-like MFS transporter